MNYRSATLGETVRHVIELRRYDHPTDGTSAVNVMVSDGAQFRVTLEEARAWRIGDILVEKWYRPVEARAE